MSTHYTKSRRFGEGTSTKERGLGERRGLCARKSILGMRSKSLGLRIAGQMNRRKKAALMTVYRALSSAPHLATASCWSWSMVGLDRIREWIVTRANIRERRGPMGGLC